MSGAPARCFHCGLPCPPGSDYRVEIDGQARPMCCPGCQAVARAIVDNGLTDFYRLRREPSRNPADLVPAALKEAELFDREPVQRSFVRETGASRCEASLILEGIVCAACVWLSERHVTALPGVESFRVNYATHRAVVRWDPERIRLSEILRAIAAIGYVAHPFDPGRQEEVFRRERRRALWRIAVAGFGAMQVMMLAVAMYAGDASGMDPGLWHFMRWVSLALATPVVLYSARPFFTAAWRDLRRRRVGMDVPVALAIGAAYLASAWATVRGHGEVYFDSATMFTFFLLTGRYLEMAARHRAGQVAEELVRILPAVASRRRADGGLETVPVAELAPGDTVVVKPGETVPADGRILEGATRVNEALMTGESRPLPRGPGDAVVGGTVNLESPIVMAVEQVGEGTVLAAIVRLLDRAQTEKPRLAALADRVAGGFVAALLVLAAGVAWWWWGHDPARAFAVTLSVLVVTCPCALSLATPAALTAATGALTRRGLLVTRGHALETLARATHVVLDKTGTLTRGRPQVERVHRLAPDWDEDGVLEAAACLEAASEHPLAQALVQGREAVPARDLSSTPGRGVEGEVGGRRLRLGTADFVAELAGPPPGVPAPGPGVTRIWLGSADGVVAAIDLADALRPEAAEAVAALRALGLEPVILSGDAPEAVARVAGALGVDHFAGGLLPADKLARVRALQESGAVVAMVGDGINDAPVLAAAQVSIAMGAGTQLAQASADMLLMAEDLRRLPEGVATARRTLAVVRQNLGWALAYNLVAVPLAAAGMVPPWAAALGMSASSLVVVVNALRLAAPRTSPAAARPDSAAVSPPGAAR